MSFGGLLMELKRYPNSMPPAVTGRGGNKERERGRKEGEIGGEK